MKLIRAFDAARRAFSSTLFDSAGNVGIRSSTAHHPLDSRKEIRPEERRQLVRKSRSLRANFGLVRNIVNSTARYSIGRGLTPSASTSDRDFNEKADAYFNAWAMSKSCDVAGRLNFYQMQRLILRETFVDGETFNIQARRDGRGQQLQLLKTERCGGGPSIGQSFWDDGIQVNDYDEPQSYSIISYGPPPGLEETVTQYSAEDVIHFFDPERIGQRRGLPWLYHGQNSLLDILDITAFEKAAVKLNSYFAGVITTPTGKAPVGVRGKAAAASGSEEIDEDTRKYQEFLGGAAIPVLKKGEEMKFFSSDRPSTSFAGFIDYLVRDICLGFGVAPELVWILAGGSSADRRFVLQQSEWFFEEIRSLLIDTFCQRVRSWVIGDAILTGKVAEPSDPEWWSCEWQGPPSQTIDKGREGRLYIDLVTSGLMSRNEWWAKQGKAGLKQRRAVIDEIAEDLAYCKEKGVPSGLYYKTMPGQAGVEEPADPGKKPPAPPGDPEPPAAE